MIKLKLKPEGVKKYLELPLVNTKFAGGSSIDTCSIQGFTTKDLLKMIIDLSTIIITAIFIVAIFGPIAYLIWKGQHRTHQSISILRTIEKEKSIKCTVYDSWNDKTIGIDSLNKKLVFVDIQSIPVNWKLLDLSRVSSCKIIDTGEIIQLMLGNDFGKESQFDVLSFFNTQTDDPLERGFHKELAKKWAQLIDKNIIKHLKTPRRAA